MKKEKRDERKARVTNFLKFYNKESIGTVGDWHKPFTKIRTLFESKANTIKTKNKIKNQEAEVGEEV